MSSFLPEEELKRGFTVNLAPMIDFLFLMLAFFASLAVTRIATRDTDIDLVKIEGAPSTTQQHRELELVHLSIGEDGAYRWVTEIRDYPMESAAAVAEELCDQHERGLLPIEKERTQVLVRIDRSAHWESVAELIFAVRDAGFAIRPVYEVGDATSGSASSR